MATGRLVWWEGSYYPGAAELTGWGVVEGDAERASLDRLRREQATEPLDSTPTENGPPERSEGHRERAERRARSRLRRYCAANKLDRLIVLTFAEPEYDLRAAQRVSRLFVKQVLRPFLESHGHSAYVIGWERHKSGAWHVNLAVSRWVTQEWLGREWAGAGGGWYEKDGESRPAHVWIEKFKGDGGRDAARKVGRYIAKYVSKDLRGFKPGMHRYEVAQGFAPAVVRVYGYSWESLVGLLTDETGLNAEYVWRAPLGRGPPIAFASLGAPAGDRVQQAQG